jgi:hypothetical protein
MWTFLSEINAWNIIEQDGGFLLRENGYHNNYSNYSILPNNKYEHLQVSNNYTSLLDEEVQDSLLTDTLERFAPKMEELDRLLSPQYTIENRERIQGEVIFKAMSSPNPSRYMDQSLKDFRRGITSGKMIHYASRYLGVHCVHAETLPKERLFHSLRKTRINQILKDSYQIYQKRMSYDMYAFQSMSYYHHGWPLQADGLIEDTMSLIFTSKIQYCNEDMQYLCKQSSMGGIA